MVVSETGAQPSCAKKSGQVRVRGFAMLVATSWLLVGCSTLSAMNPVNWWHRQEGGKIAEQRPEPPGADAPYPNIATVPAKPEAPDAEELRKLTASLVADRTNAQHAAQSAPLADPSSPTASPGLFGIGTAPPPSPVSMKTPSVSSSAPASGPQTASASMPAVNAPVAPANPAPPTPAPRKAVQSTPLEVPAAPVAPKDAVDPTPPPPLPAAPPMRPAAAGAPPGVPVVSPPMPAPVAGVAAAIVFPDRASNLSAAAEEEVKAFAAKRGNGTIAITGYGDASSNDPDAQSAAVNLGLSRAQSILNVLKAAGVPGTAIRVSAEASGRGASLHLLQ